MLKCSKLLVYLVGLLLSACGAMDEQDYDLQDHAQTAPQFNGVGSSPGFRITDDTSQLTITTTDGATGFMIFYVYILQWAQQGKAEAFSQVSIAPGYWGGGGIVTTLNPIENIPIGVDVSFAASSLNLTPVVGGACAFDYSNVPIMEPGTIRVDGYDSDGNGVIDLNKVLVSASFSAEIPLQRVESPSDNCVTKKYRFHAATDVILNPESFRSSPTAPSPPPIQAQPCKFKPLFAREQWYHSGITLNHCLCNNGTWVSTNGGYCKNWN